MRLIDLIRAYLRPKPAPPPPGPLPSGDLPARLLAAVNLARWSAGAGPLAPNPLLTATAGVWAAKLAVRGGGIDHGDFAGRVQAAGYAGPASEDIAAGQRTPEEAVADWLADPPHRRSVLDRAYTAAGCGVATHPGGWTYFVLDLGG